jgi:hypothetical protein
MLNVLPEKKLHPHCYEITVALNIHTSYVRYAMHTKQTTKYNIQIQRFRCNACSEREKEGTPRVQTAYI